MTASLGPAHAIVLLPFSYRLIHPIFHPTGTDAFAEGFASLVVDDLLLVLLQITDQIRVLFRVAGAKRSQEGKRLLHATMPEVSQEGTLPLFALRFSAGTHREPLVHPPFEVIPVEDDGDPTTEETIQICPDAVGAVGDGHQVQRCLRLPPFQPQYRLSYFGDR